MTFVCLNVDTIFWYFVRALIQSDGVKGEVTLSQRSPFDPTWIQMNLTSTNDKYTGRVTKTSAYKIHELPPVPLPSINIKDNHCLKTGSVFNPSNIQEDQGMWNLVSSSWKTSWQFFTSFDKSCCLYLLLLVCFCIFWSLIFNSHVMSCMVQMTMLAIVCH